MTQLLSGTREISVFRDLGLEKNLSHKAHIATAADIHSCLLNPSGWKEAFFEQDL